jgi:N-methylhydantoinase A/oxoprolinase/acetone carboxylase beta subunit
MILGSLEKNIFEHISLMAQEQIEVEFREEIVQIQQMQMAMQQMMSQGPQMQQSPQMQQMQQQLLGMQLSMESRKAKLIAEMTQEFMEEENKIMGELGNDPIAKLKARELDLKAQDDSRKEQEGQEKINIDKMKAMMNQNQHEDKLNQNEELAELRADTSLTKTQMGIDSKRQSDIFKQRDVSILKGPRR